VSDCKRSASVGVPDSAVAFHLVGEERDVIGSTMRFGGTRRNTTTSRGGFPS
jgi:hypothetical protein